MKFLLRLAMVACAMSPCGQIAAQVSMTGEVPGHSVVAQWSATFQTVLKARETRFANFVLPAAKSPRTYSDAELISGISGPVSAYSEIRHTPDMPKLEGTEDCNLATQGGVVVYQCYFRAHGNSAVDWQNDYVRLIRLVEEATGGTAQPTKPVVSTTAESRVAIVVISNLKNLVWVNEEWLKIEKPEAGRDGRSRLRVSILSDEVSPLNTTTTSVLGGSEIDEVIKSGQYRQMPPSQRVGSTGSGLVSIKITNDTEYSLNLLYQGTASKSMTIPAGETSTIELPPGSYRELGRVSAPNVLPFIGNEIFNAGDTLVSHFLIR